MLDVNLFVSMQIRLRPKLSVHGLTAKSKSPKL